MNVRKKLFPSYVPHKPAGLTVNDILHEAGLLPNYIIAEQGPNVERGAVVVLKAAEGYLKMLDPVTGEACPHQLRAIIQHKEDVRDWGIMVLGGQLKRVPRAVSVVIRRSIR